MDLGLKGRRALVMGASKGLGRAIAEALSAEGATVTVASRDEAALKALAEGLSAKNGVPAFAIKADVANEAGMDALADEAVLRMGGVDVLILNHGGPPVGSALDLSLDELKAQFQKMVVAPIRIAMRLLPAMRERKWGRIIAVGSSGMVQPLPNMVLSNTLRAAIVGWNKTLSAEVAADGVTCNILAPGSILTDRSKDTAGLRAKREGITVEEAIRRNTETIPARRYGTPEEYGAVAAFLASEKASYVTGSIIRVDGGNVRAI
jgi:3-oxoacyl-[acyl-carrier protein] reductase